MKSELNVAVCQMNSLDDIALNLAQIESLIMQAATSGEQTGSPGPKVDLVCFPENCLYFRMNEADPIPGFEIQDQAFEFIAAICKKYQLNVHLGSVPLRMNDHLYNSSVLVTGGGEIRPSYQKMHLFDICLEGRAPIRETDVFRHGQGFQVFELNGWRIGQSICYDLRFAELFAAYSRREIDLILVPSAFLVETGRSHWEILLRARAIESQCFILASAQGGVHRNSAGYSRETYGHSSIIGPWGEILGIVEVGVGVLKYTLTKGEIERVRKQIPMRDHRRISQI